MQTTYILKISQNALVVEYRPHIANGGWTPYLQCGLYSATFAFCKILQESFCLHLTTLRKNLTLNLRVAMLYCLECCRFELVDSKTADLAIGFLGGQQFLLGVAINFHCSSHPLKRGIRH